MDALTSNSKDVPFGDNDKHNLYTINTVQGIHNILINIYIYIFQGIYTTKAILEALEANYTFL